jgi:ankyrin repeat protein
MSRKHPIMVLGLPFKSSVPRAAAALLASLSLVLAGPALANEKVCRSLKQRYEQIEKAASSMPLSHAAAAGQAELVALFLEHDAPIDGRSINGSTALYEAAEAGRLPIVQLLLARGADASLGRKGLTPLSAASYMGSEPIVELLIEKGVDPKAVDETRKTAIVYAAGKGFSGVVRLLLDHGVDVNARYGNDLTALMWAVGYTDEAGVDDVAKVMTLLIDRGAQLDDQDNRGRTALMIAAELGHTGAAELLISRGADRNIHDKDGKSASDLARDETLRAELAAK